jgi:hypothetical protein
MTNLPIKLQVVTFLKAVIFTDNTTKHKHTPFINNFTQHIVLNIQTRASALLVKLEPRQLIPQAIQRARVQC